MKNALELPTGTWVLDTSATTLAVSTKMMLAFTVPATLTVTSAAIEIAEGQVVTVDVTVDASSYTSKMAKRNEHVVSPDFLDAAKYPEIQF
jgi:polyisoprenoid-binding protein YceI